MVEDGGLETTISLLLFSLPANFSIVLLSVKLKPPSYKNLINFLGHPYLLDVFT